MAWGELINGEHTYDPHAAQQEALLSTSRFTAFVGGTGSGKTAIGALWMAHQIKQWADNNVIGFMGMTVSPTYKILNRATVPMLVETFRGTDLEGVYIPSKSQYVLPNGMGIIWCLSADNSDGLEGGQFDAVWLDEGGQCKFDVFVALMGRTGLKQAPIFISTTPYKLNWLKSDFLDRARDGDADYKVITCSSKDNPAYSEEEYERARRVLPPALFRMRYDGEFSSRDGLIYSGFDDDYNQRPCFYDPDLPIIVGSDFNVAPMAWVLMHRYDDRLEVFDELYVQNTTTQKTLDFLYEKYKEHKGGFQFYGDASSKARNTRASLSDYQQIYNDVRFHKLGRTVHYLSSNPPVADRIACVNGLFCSATCERRLFIDSACENLIRDLTTSYYKEGTRIPHATPDNLHITDALGYVCNCIFPLMLHVDKPTLRQVSY